MATIIKDEKRQVISEAEFEVRLRTCSYNQLGDYPVHTLLRFEDGTLYVFIRKGYWREFEQSYALEKKAGRWEETKDEMVPVPDAEFDSVARSHGYNPKPEWTALSVRKAGITWIYMKQSRCDYYEAKKVRAAAEWDYTERIREARRSVQIGEVDESEVTIQERREIWLFAKAATLDEMKAYAEAEEQIAEAQLERREIVKAAGIRAGRWNDG
jgi:hypothetical protein